MMFALLCVCVCVCSLFDTLTVAEHLTLFAVLKGTPAHQVAQCVQEKIAEVGLVAKTDVYSMALSGGMKRKLSVGMALIGDSKIVFLGQTPKSTPTRPRMREPSLPALSLVHSMSRC